jgi:hypothetical protein
MPACLPYLTCTYLGTRNPALATRLNRSCAAGSTVYANALEHFNPLPSSQAMSARPDGTVPTGGKWKKKQKKKKKMNSVRKTASAENLLCPRTQPTVDGHLPRYFYYSELGLFFNSFRFHFHFHFHFLPQGQCPFPRSTSLTSQASTPNSARAPAYQ